MRRALLLPLLALAMLLPAAPAVAHPATPAVAHPAAGINAAHSPQNCFDWQPSLYYRMVVCASVHHASGQAVPHVVLHTYKRPCSSCAWGDMVADSQSINAWVITTQTGFIVGQAPFSGGGVALRTVHGTGWVSLNCPNDPPYFAGARVQRVSMRTDAGVPYGPVTINLDSPSSARPC
jgi:hypothetical protein